ncbi:putative acetyltransferase [Altererythrobacter xiamenensis]|uniref:Putative acetyltransferase n=1 Tax=Altererythrobacter xiamenensis TaxID=1316679 RepID=A0A1Y6F5F6_9SPHN|nr:N-acetyltransferase [Altererythrobacter xiamenensis]SMQ68781.1 putative acetyltransferase [Altererythrobacter xiamenensis]
MTTVLLRPELPHDHGAIHELTEAAFRDMPYSDGDEADLVDKLRDAGDLSLSLVAEDGGQIVGHIAFSPVTISDGTQGWYGLGPVSVIPRLQKQGIGFRLIQRGIADMRESGAKGIVLLGDPQYYARFGFRHEPQLTYPGAPAEYFQAVVLDGDLPTGEVRYTPAFG